MNPAELTTYITSNFSGQLETVENDQAEPYFIVGLSDLVPFSKFIHDDPKLELNYLMNMAGVDTGEQFEVVLNPCSLLNKQRLFFKVVLDRTHPIFDTVSNLWAAANWYEREIWELYGFDITGHPNLKRFLLPDDWDDGFPLRKGWIGKNVIPLPEK